MSHKWFRDAIIVIGVFAVLAAIVALVQSRVQDSVFALAIGLFMGVAFLETHLRQVMRDHEARVAQHHG